MKSNVKFITSIIFLILLKFNAKSQTHNYQDQVVNKVNIVNTSSNPFDYDNWQLESSDEQKIIVSLIPSGIDELYMQQYNSSFILNVWNSAQIMFTLQVQWDNNGYVSLAIPTSGAISVNNILPPAAFRSIGDHNLKVKYTSQNGMIYNREFIVHVVPTASRFYKNNLNPSILTCGNTITLWENANNPNAIPILISEGFDAYNTTFAEFYAYAGKNLISELINNGYKVYILDYEYNTQSMKNSAAIFNSAVRFISSINGNINIIAGGISMGGVIARYSITKAENDKAALPVFKFISIDAPQQGAFVSPELQKVIDDHTDDSSFEAHGLNNDAAKQLLKINRYDHSGLHKSFYNELNNLNCGFGYPKLCETIGVSFSNPNITRSVNGTWLQINVLDYYFLSDNIVLTMPEKVPGSLLPKSSVGGTSGNFGFIKGAIEVERYLDPTYISHNSSLDKIGEDSKFNVTIISNGNNFHDVFPIEVISPLISALALPFKIADYVNLDISNNVIWNTPQKIQGIITIKSGAVLTIENTKISLFTDGKFIVEPGAKLLIKHSTLTAMECNKWGGIIVKGNKSLPQNQTNQGYLHVVNSTIEKSNLPINVFDGGIVIASTSTFKNCFGNYFTFYPYVSMLNNKSIINNCTFKDASPSSIQSTNRAYIFGTSIKGLKITNNHFEGDLFPTNYSYSGISLVDATMIATGNDITGMSYGIRISAINGSINPNYICANSINQCKHGILIFGNGYVKISNNEFQENSVYSFKTAFSSGFDISENTFVNFDSKKTSNGVIIVSSQSNGGSIYKNLFRGFNVSTMADQSNAYLNIDCNTFSEYNNAIGVTSGQLGNQGTCINAINDNTLPVVNFFENGCGTNPLQIAVNEFASDLNYSTYSDNPLTLFSIGKVHQEYCLPNYSENYCPPKYNNDCFNTPGCLTGLWTLYNDINITGANRKLIFNDIIRNTFYGDTIGTNGIAQLFEQSMNKPEIQRLLLPYAIDTRNQELTTQLLNSFVIENENDEAFFSFYLIMSLLVNNESNLEEIYTQNSEVISELARSNFSVSNNAKSLIEYVTNTFYDDIIPEIENYSHGSCNFNSELIKSLDQKYSNSIGECIPNPNIDVSKVLVTCVDNNFLLLIVDIYGRKIRTIELSKGENSIELYNSDFASGVYSLILYKDSEILDRSKIIVN